HVELLGVGQIGGGAGEDVGAGVVDPDIDATERALGIVSEIGDRGGVSQVQTKHVRASAQALDLGGRRPGLAFFVAVCDRDVRTCVRSGQCDGSTNTCGSAGNEDT